MKYRVIYWILELAIKQLEKDHVSELWTNSDWKLIRNDPFICETVVLDDAEH